MTELRAAAAAFSLALMAAAAAPGLAQTTPTVGSANTAVADPPVPRPRTQPVQVPLFSGLTFANYTPKAFSYTPPPAVQHWAKVVLVADFSVSAGRQFDRTAQIAIGGANVYFGTTPEPSGTVSRSWHVERDVTDDSALLKLAQSGEVDLGNTVNSTYTGIISGSAYLQFYPPGPGAPSAEVPDVVLPLPNTSNGTGSLNSSGDVLTETFTFPTNTVRAYLDLITQSQGSDEFWYLGVPDALESELEDNGGTAFREAEITVDGMPAGVAPVYPWIYTGGIDPYLWRPIPGVQTLNFVPYRVDLTPFAGMFNDGKPHSVGVQVFNDANYFQVAGTLFLYRDPRLPVVKGALTADTLSAEPTPVVTENLSTVSGETTGPVSVTSVRQFTVAGYVQTSLGKVSTQVSQNIQFSSVQQFDVSPTVDDQSTVQTTTVSSATTTQLGFLRYTQQKQLAYPLTLSYLYAVNADGTSAQTVTVKQGYLASEIDYLNGFPFYARAVSNQVTPTDTLLFDVNGNLTGTQNQTSAQTYRDTDPLGSHYSRTITAANGLLTSVTDGPNTLGK